MHPPRFTLRQLGYFLSVAESGSIKAAAERLHISQAALSQALHELETELGSTLLTRRRAQGVTLTAAGIELAGNARAVLDAAGDLQAAAAGLERGLSGRVRIDCYTSLAPFLIPRLMSGFRERFPTVRLEALEGAATGIQARLRSGACEIALLYDVDLDEDIGCEPLYRVRPQVMLAADHPLAAREKVELAALRSEPLILYDVAPSIRNTEGVFRQAGVEPVVAHRTTSFELVRSLVARGLGYSILLQTPQQPVSYEGRALVARPIEGDRTEIAVAVAWARSGRTTRRTELLRSACAELCQA